MDDSIEKRLKRIKNSVKTYPDFPREGIIFRDIFPLFLDHTLIEDVLYVIKHFIDNNFQQKSIDAVVGLESRGFLFGPLLAQQLHCSFIPIRKRGKLPGSVESIEYQLEYGQDCFEIQIDPFADGRIENCLIIDDLLATGGSIESSLKLLKKCNVNPMAVIVIIELLELNGRKRFEHVPTFSLIHF